MATLKLVPSAVLAAKLAAAGYPPGVEPWTTPAEAARRLGMTRQALYVRWLPRGFGYRVGGRWRVPVRLLEAAEVGDWPLEKGAESPEA